MGGCSRAWAVIAAAVLVVLFAGCGRAANRRPSLSPPPSRWVFMRANFQADETAADSIRAIERFADEGYTGVVVGDYKFIRLDQVPPNTHTNLAAFRAACSRRGLTVIASVVPIGYSNAILSRDPNLAEGLPVREAEFVVRGGQALPRGAEPGQPPLLDNGGFERHSGHSPAGWSFVDQPGRVTFIDTEVKAEGAASLRMENIDRYEPEHRHARACAKLKVRPFRHYHVSALVRTRGWTGGDTRITAMGSGDRVLNFAWPAIGADEDWRRVDVTFNSLDNETVNLYVGTWDGRGGTIWWDDVRVEEAGLLNLIRRDGAPFRLTSADGRDVYVGGRDYEPPVDPKMGNDPYAGEYSVWHDPPPLLIPAGSRIRDGQSVLASYAHAMPVGDGQVMCCMREPELYRILQRQIEQVRDRLQPDGYLMNHDEIRVQGWDASCEASGLTPAESLADNVSRCADIIRRADPGKRICVWSDMFDPHHNARAGGYYYLVRGRGAWSGSWRGLSPDVTVVNWQFNPRTRMDTLRHFAGLGCRQILAGFYDGDPAFVADWLRDADGVPGVDGVMYTTWRNDYTQTAAFIRAASAGR